MSEPGRTSVVAITAHPDGGWKASVIGKRTYGVYGGQCYAAEEQVPLVEEPIYQGDFGMLVHDTDLVTNRARCDVVVTGHAYPRGNELMFDASVAVGSLNRTVRVFGPRRCELVRGEVHFAPEWNVEPVSLDWTHAYGGYDRAALAAHGDPLEGLMEALGQPYDPRFGTYAYPRNPAGTGYVTERTADALDGLVLPQLEDLGALLTPWTVVRGAASEWPNGPPVAAFGWLSYNYFPRIAQSGLPPLVYDEARCPPAHFLEVLSGEMRAASAAFNVPLAERLDFGMAQGSALGMRASEVPPGAPVYVARLHPRMSHWQFTLPAQPPRVGLQLPGAQPVELTPAIRTVLLEPDIDRVCLVWVAEHRLSMPVGPTQAAGIRHAVVWGTS